MRRQLSSTVTSIGVPSSAFSRYLASQICCDSGESLPRTPPSGPVLPQLPDLGPRLAGLGSRVVICISIVLSWSSLCLSRTARGGGRGKGAIGGSAGATHPCGGRRRVALVSTSSFLLASFVPAGRDSFRTAAAIRRH